MDRRAILFALPALAACQATDSTNISPITGPDEDLRISEVSVTVSEGVIPPDRSRLPSRASEALPSSPSPQSSFTDDLRGILAGNLQDIYSPDGAVLEVEITRVNLSIPENELAWAVSTMNGTIVLTDESGRKTSAWISARSVFTGRLFRLGTLCGCFDEVVYSTLLRLFSEEVRMRLQGTNRIIYPMDD